MLFYLSRCAASVLDQEIADIEYLVQDSCSSDGTREWLARQSRINWRSEPDNGMYDALNKGIARSRGDIVGYLNCDEQYLSGALRYVETFFEREPDVDMLFGSALIVGPDGKLLAARRSYRPSWVLVAAGHLYNLSCGMFFRRRILGQGDVFDTSYRDVGDAEFVIRKLREGIRARHSARFLSAFTLTGKNMSLGENARDESTRLFGQLPWYFQTMKLELNIVRRVWKALDGAYERRPIEYSLYTNDTNTREYFRVHQPTPLWPRG